MTAPVDTTFTSGTVITSQWLNGVNDHVNDLESNAHSAANIENIPSGGVAATNVQSAINELDTEKVAFTRLDDSDGSSLVGFMQSGTGAVSRTTQDKMREFVSVKDFGAVGDGVADDTAAIQAAVNYCAANWLVLEIKGGSFLCGAITAPAGALRWHGDGTGTLTRTGTDVTLIAPTGDVDIEGVGFSGYRRGFDFSSVPDGAVLRFRKNTITNCGTILNNNGAGPTRNDFYGFIWQNNPTNANAPKMLEFVDNIVDGKDFCIAWLAPVDRVLVQGNHFSNMRRIGVMLGITGIEQKLITNVSITDNHFVNIVGDSTNEYEIHAVLAYGYRVDVSGNTVETCYDIHATVHDSEALYVRAVFATVTNNHIKNGGYGDGYIVVKGSPSADDPDSTAAVDLARHCIVANNIIYQSSSFTHPSTTDGIFINGENVDAVGNQVRGSFNVAISHYGCGNITNNTIVTGTTGIYLTQDSTRNPGSRTISAIRDNLIQHATSYGIRYVLASGTAQTVKGLTISGNEIYSTGVAADEIRVEIQKDGTGNILSNLTVSDNLIHMTDTTTVNGIGLYADIGTGAVNGVISNYLAMGNHTNGGSNVYRHSGVAGNFVNGYITDGHHVNIGNRVMNNPSLFTTLKVGRLTGQRPSVSAGTATIAAGNTSVTVTMSLQDTLRPTTLQNIRVTPNGDWLTSAKWWVDTLSADTFVIRVNAAPGGAGIAFSWEAVNAYWY